MGNVAVFIVDPHSIFRLGLATCLEELPLVGRVTGVAIVQAASRHGDLATSDIVFVDASAPNALAFIREVRGAGTARVIVSASSMQEKDILATMEAGAVCVLRKDTLTPESLEASVRATLQGAGNTPALKACVEKGATAIRVKDVDTGAATADITLSFIAAP